MTPARRAVEFLMEVNSLEAVPRAGYTLCGIRRPENVAAHTAGMAAAALMIADRIGEPVDRGRLLTMVLLHDVGEARTGDIPLIEKTDADEEREALAVAEILDALPDRYARLVEEFRDGETLEARIAQASDKLQLMAKVLAYESQGRGDLSRFWVNLGNFGDAGLPEARELYEAIRSLREQARPVFADPDSKGIFTSPP